MDIGERIKAARKSAGLTQKQLGEKLGVSAAMIAQYETGKRTPKIDTIQKIANAVNASIDPTFALHSFVEAANNLYDSIENELKKQQPPTIAAHFNADEYTPEELEEIRQFAEFVKSKRPKPSGQDE